MFVECNPKVWQMAEESLTASLPVGAGVVGIPEGAGLGVEINEERLRPFIVAC
jgi:L-alanine-DL-glutamate epimerase-like enolase superfamily enzyme